MCNKKRVELSGWLSILFLAFVLCVSTPALGFEPGKTYDKHNIQEIENLLITPVANWVKNDGWIIRTVELQDGFKWDDGYLELSKKNEGKYDVNENGLLVLKNGSPDKGVVLGLPFPTIDPKDPNAAQKIMENHHYGNYRKGSGWMPVDIEWIGTDGFERYFTAIGIPFQWQAREKPIPNPKNYLTMLISAVTAPFDLRGTNQMSWQFDDEREDISFAYVPMLRRVRRVSAATRSDPFLGSDIVLDDNDMWYGKNSSMTWNFLGGKKLLMPFCSNKMYIMPENPDGSFCPLKRRYKYGYQDPSFKGVAWAPLDVYWTLRDVWLVEATPKDPYYSYGKQIFYLDQEVFVNFVKEIYNWSGEYWKTNMATYQMQGLKDGSYNAVDSIDVELAVDDKAHHASTAEAVAAGYQEPNLNYIHRLPMTKLNPDFFTETNLRQMSK